MPPLTPADLAAARTAALVFLEAVQRGDEPAARALLIIGAGESLDFKTMHASTEKFELGEAKAEGDAAVAVAAITAKPGQSAPPALPLVLVRRDGAWKVDMGASMNRMLGVDLNQLVSEMAKGLGQAMEAGMGAMAKGLEALGGGAAEAPKKAKKGKRGKPRGSGGA